MANKTIPELTSADALTTSALVEIAQVDGTSESGYVSRKASLSDLSSVIGGGGSSNVLVVFFDGTALNRPYSQIADMLNSGGMVFVVYANSTGSARVYNLAYYSPSSGVVAFEAIYNTAGTVDIAQTLYYDRLVLNSTDTLTRNYHFAFPMTEEATDIEISPSDFSLESTPTFEGYPYKATFTVAATPNSGYTVGEITPSMDMINAGIFCPLCTCTNGRVTIYASAVPSVNYTIPRATCRTETSED